MKSFRIQPYIVGSGRSALALERSLGVLNSSGYQILEPQRVKRNEALKKISQDFSLLLIANPHALHSERILEGSHENFDLIVSEKPACVSKDEIEKLKNIKSPVAICHVYRQSWGIQTINKMIQEGSLGEIIAIEGRYWQSSAAQASLHKAESYASLQQWKNDTKLSGPFDALIDIATHWTDTVLFLAKTKVTKNDIWLSHINSENSHRDTHVHINLEFENKIKAMGSISKTVHGAGNHFEINVMGSKKTVTWNFLEADQLTIGEGTLSTKIRRNENTYGSGQSAFHALGWIEGYIEILKQSILHARGQSYVPYPTLAENLNMLELLLTKTPHK